jgi:hypothetical protein
MNVNTMSLAKTHACADTGATSIFVMEELKLEMENVQIADNPLSINLPDGAIVKSTHTCDVVIPGLPTVLTGHIVQGLTMASLVGIRILCKAGCIVIFTDKYCDVMYNEKLILRGYKDPQTDLWILPITRDAINNQSTVGKDLGDQKNPQPIQVAGFTHSVQTRANAVKFAHQSLCNPKISTLMKALKKGFLKGCPHMNEELVTKYLNPSPATAKGHMKGPKKGIRSTTRATQIAKPIAQSANPSVLPIFVDPPSYPGPAYKATNSPTIIEDDNESIANLFCFGAFADKVTGVIYNDLTGNFPFMSLDGSVCFFVMYHYETNSILVTPIANLDDKSIFEAFKAKFEMLEEKGYKPKVNVMDNQATKYIKQFLTNKECTLQLVKPHNHRVNAAE